VGGIHEEFARTADPRLLAELVQEYDRYALSLARRLDRGREPLEDLQQVAREGLVLALKRFDPSRGIPFPAFATPTILGSLRRHYRDRGWSVRVPRWVHETTVRARRAREELIEELGREPSTSEVARVLDLAPDVLDGAAVAAQARNVSSLDAATPGDESRHSRVGRLDPAMERVDELLSLGRAMSTLSDRDREVLGLYYFTGRSQSEIASTYGVSQMQVSRWLSSAVARLRGQVLPAPTAAA